MNLFIIVLFFYPGRHCLTFKTLRTTADPSSRSHCSCFPLGGLDWVITLPPAVLATYEVVINGIKVSFTNDKIILNSLWSDIFNLITLTQCLSLVIFVFKAHNHTDQMQQCWLLMPDLQISSVCQYGSRRVLADLKFPKTLGSLFLHWCKKGKQSGKCLLTEPIWSW